MTDQTFLHRATCLAAIAAAAALTACGREGGDTSAASQRESTIVTADAEQSTRRSESATTMGTQPSQVSETTAGSTAAPATAGTATGSSTASGITPPSATTPGMPSARGTADAGGSKVQDAAITASVNAELARDPGLSALAIDVDTNGGHVVLSGTAPDAPTRERATQLASAVRGVSGVDNRLEIRG
jgi:hyperosmotically inducible periplasmic protein